MSDREIMNAKGYSRVSPTKPKIQPLPDARKHQIVSFAKSTVRIVGYILIPFNLESAAIVLILSEIIGIVEELV
tara:strand:- start:347 stop:568 length:222 start_codon:yes stop_codon:yes gene_type:complete